MGKLDEKVYVVNMDTEEITEHRIRDLDGYIDETTTPDGVGPRYHVRGKELWSWGPGGNAPYRIAIYDTEEEAVEALEETFYQDFMNSDKFNWFFNRVEAEQWVKDNPKEKE